MGRDSDFGTVYMRNVLRSLRFMIQEEVSAGVRYKIGALERKQVDVLLICFDEELLSRYMFSDCTKTSVLKERIQIVIDTTLDF